MAADDWWKEDQAAGDDWWREDAVEEVAPKSPYGPVTQVLRGANVGLEKTAGTPMDLYSGVVNPVYDFLGLPTTDEPLFGSRWNQRMLSKLGIGYAPEHDPSFLEGAGEIAGQTVGAGGVVTGLARKGGAALAAGAKPVPRPGIVGGTKDIAERMAAPAFKNPGAALATETMTGLGAGVGGETAKAVAPDSPAAEMAGQLAGGWGGYVARELPLTATGMAWKSSKWALDQSKRALQKTFSPEGAKIMAEDRLRGLSNDPQGSGARIGATDPRYRLSPAEETGERGIMALQRSAQENDLKFDEATRQRHSIANRQLYKDLEDLGTRADVADAKEFFDLRRETLRKLIDVRIAQAKTQASETLQSINVTTDRDQVGRVVRSSLESALKDARRQESELWGGVNGEVVVPTSNAWKTYQELTRSSDPRLKQTYEDIPEYLRKLFDPESNSRMGDQEKAAFLQKLRSDMLDDARAAGSGMTPNPNQVRILTEMRAAVMRDLESVPGNEGYKTAVSFSRDLNDKFTRGPVGRVLSFATEGGEKIDPELTLQSMVGKGGLKGDVSIRRIREASDTPETQAALRDYMANLFREQAIDPVSGMLRPQAAQRFLIQNREILESMPDLSEEIGGAVGASQTAQRAGDAGLRRLRTVDDTRSPSEQFARSRLGNELTPIFNARRPEEAMGRLVASAKRDQTGRAMLGLKGAYSESILQRARGSTTDDLDTPFLSGKKLQAILNDEANLLGQVYTPEEIGRLKIVTDVATRIETAQDVKALERMIAEAPPPLLMMVARMAGAKAGAAIGQGSSSLLLAGAYSRWGRKLIEKTTVGQAEKIVERSITDPKLMRALLTDPRKLATEAERKAAEKFIQGEIFQTVPELRDVLEDD